MNEPQEKVLVEAFAFLYLAARNGHLKGNLTPAQHVDLLEKMAGCFRDYLVLQQSEIATKIAIEKAKSANTPT